MFKYDFYVIQLARLVSKDLGYIFADIHCDSSSKSHSFSKLVLYAYQICTFQTAVVHQVYNFLFKKI